MFICKKCGTEDKFELMFSPDYKGDCKTEYIYDKKDIIKIKVDDYTFTPDLAFMNNFAVCGHCGSIYCWGKSKKVQNDGISRKNRIKNA